MDSLKWAVVEYEQKDRTSDWFWALGIIIIAGSITSVILRDYFFAILLLIGGVCLVMFAIKKPEMINYELNEKGLQINNTLYEYKRIKSFFVRIEGKPTLFIKSSRLFLPLLSADLVDISPQEVKQIMLDHNIPEEEMKEHFSEHIMERLGL